MSDANPALLGLVFAVILAPLFLLALYSAPFALRAVGIDPHAPIFAEKDGGQR